MVSYTYANLPKSPIDYLILQAELARAIIVWSGLSIPLFLTKPPLNLQTVEIPFVRQFSYRLVLHEISSLSPPKNQIFQRTPKILRIFIINPILKFKSNYILVIISQFGNIFVFKFFANKYVRY